MTGSERYTGGDTMPPYPVMHGFMWKEPQTVKECFETRCKECAYRDTFKFCNDGVYPIVCGHLTTMRHVERLERCQTTRS